MKIYVVRHGQSESNAAGIHSGQHQFELTEQGKKEAEEAGELLRGIKFDKVYSSDLVRANMTGKIALPGYEIEQLSLIRELDVGWIAGKNIKELEEELGEEFVNDKRNCNYCPYGGENSEMILARAKSFLDLLAERGDETVAVFTHAGFVKTMLSAVLETWIPMRKLLCANCSLTVFEYKNAKWQLVSWNTQNEIKGGNVW